MSSLSPLVVIVGETASGKSRLALELARRYGGEIISADSWAVRKELNVGTAKPTPQDLKTIPHHLLNVVKPCQAFTAAIYKRLALKAINDILSRGKLPIIVGGSGLYIDGVIFDFSFMPGSTISERNKLNKLSIEELLKIIRSKGFSLTGIDIRNKRRLIRLIENSGKKPTKKSLRPNTLILGLKTSRIELSSRVIDRTEKMLRAGLRQETKALASKYGWECEGLKGIGYKEWQAHFDGTQSLAETKAAIIKSTLDLAKRQRTYFKRNQFIQWVENVNEARAAIESFLNKKF